MTKPIPVPGPDFAYSIEHPSNRDKQIKFKFDNKVHYHTSRVDAMVTNVSVPEKLASTMLRLTAAAVLNSGVLERAATLETKTVHTKAFWFTKDDEFEKVKVEMQGDMIKEFRGWQIESFGFFGLKPKMRDGVMVQGIDVVQLESIFDAF
jgi:hypothetical protein